MFQKNTGTVGLGLVSFLAIANRAANPNIGGRNIAGGSDAIEAILKGRLQLETGDKCDDYPTCYHAANRLFWRDPFFKEFAHVFRQHFAGVPFLLAGGMDFGRTWAKEKINTVGASCTSNTGILNKNQLRNCTRDTHAYLATQCNNLGQLDTGYCLSSIARLIIIDALFSDYDTSRNKFAPHTGAGSTISSVDIRFATKSWHSTNGPQFQWSCDPGKGYAKLFDLVNVRTRFRKREVHRQAHHHNQRHH